jgi:type VI secretion system Hcp family effector
LQYILLNNDKDIIDVSNVIYLTLTGERQGEISAGCGTEKSIGNRFQYRHENEILV